MAQEIRAFEVTIPAGTAKSAGWSQAISMPPRVVKRIDWRVPPGPRGNMGFAIGASGEAILPTNEGAWIVADDDRDNWPLENQIDSGGWEVFGYNTGTYDHTVYLRFHVDPIPVKTSTILTPVSV